jgi:hypothetical protein
MDRDPQFPFFGFQNIPHYHGDYVRQLFVAAAALCLVAIPLWGDILPLGALVQIGSVILLVLLAGLTSPHGRIVLIFDAVVSALGILFLEGAAINLYAVDPFPLFLCREAAALLLLGAFYFSVKTARAMSQHKVGHLRDIGEFDEKGPR